jgi:serine/threonine protein kinase
VKRLMLDSRWGAKDLSTIHKEAIILERMSSSPRVINTYGSCGTTMLVEAMASDLHTKIILDDGFASQEKLNKLDDVQPLNDFSTSEKLQITLDMAESLAYLHGFEGGPIVHGDTHIEQWLIASDGSIRLNDFNNAHVPEWDQMAGDYCTTRSSYGGTVSSLKYWKFVMSFSRLPHL